MNEHVYTRGIYLDKKIVQNMSFDYVKIIITHMIDIDNIRKVAEWWDEANCASKKADKSAVKFVYEYDCKIWNL